MSSDDSSQWQFLTVALPYSPLTFDERFLLQSLCFVLFTSTVKEICHLLSGAQTLVHCYDTGHAFILCFLTLLWWPHREGKASGQVVCLLTLKGDFTLSGSAAGDMAELVTMFLGGLAERSRYAVALREVDRQGQKRTGHAQYCLLSHWSHLIDLLTGWFLLYSSIDDPTFLSFKKGELIVIIKDDEFSQQRGWIKGQIESTKQTGAVPTDAVLILPTLNKPTNELMVRTRQWHIFVR